MLRRSKLVSLYGVWLYFFLGCAAFTSACFAWGLRAAWKQAKPLKPNELTSTHLLGGVGFASRALGIATLLTVSGFGLLVLGISAALDVNTPKQVWLVLG